MNLPSDLIDKPEWVFLGPLGPELPSRFHQMPTLGIDGGARFFSPLTVWVGDHDSLKGHAEALHSFSLPPEKDKSDLASALDLLENNLHYRLHFWGFVGGRRDHELFNIGEALSFLDRNPESEIIFYADDGKVFYHLLGAGIWRFSHEGLFSLGTLRKTQVKLTGQCAYAIPSLKTLFPLSSFGLSNIGKGQIVLETEGPVFLTFPEEK